MPIVQVHLILTVNYLRRKTSNEDFILYISNQYRTVFCM